MSFPTQSEDDYIMHWCWLLQLPQSHEKIDLQVHRPRSDRPGYGLSNDRGEPPGSHFVADDRA